MLILGGKKCRNYGVQESPASGKERKSTAAKYPEQKQKQTSSESLDLT